MLISNLILLAETFGTPRIDFSLHMGTLAFMILCGALITAVIASFVVLGLYSEKRKREAAHHDTWIEESDQYRDDEEAEPFIPDAAQPDVETTSASSKSKETASEPSGLSRSRKRELTEVAFG